jgi:mannobiose 2-epimerase
MKERLKSLRTALDEELRENILLWWMTHSPDCQHGGFHGHIDHHNLIVKHAGKGAVMHARILWTFAAAYRMYHIPSYLETARRAFLYIVKHFTDKKYGGVFWELDYDGQVKSDRKQIYAMAFTIYGLAEFHRACGDERALKVAKSLFLDLEAHAFDRERNGYVDALSRDWQPVEDLRLSEKDQNESKTMNTHLHILEAYANLHRVWKDEKLSNALANLVDLFLEKFIDLDKGHLKLFFDDDWVLRSTMVSYGHDIEAAWLVQEAAEALDDPRRIERSKKVAVHMARVSFEGLDVDGALFYETMPEEDRTDTDKHWWVQAEAMVGYMNAFQLSGEEVFAQKVFDSWGFIRQYLIDMELGEWIWSTDKEGNPRTSAEKAGFWKCPYHNGRACMELIRRIDTLMLSKQV